MKIKEFLWTNRLKNKDLAEYLGVTDTAISRMCKGEINPSRLTLAKILNNDRGWDTSMLMEEMDRREDVPAAPQVGELEMLREQVKALQIEVSVLQRELDFYHSVFAKAVGK